MSRQEEALAQILSDQWCVYQDREIWTGDNPETHGDELLTVQRVPRGGMMSGFAQMQRDKAVTIAPEVAQHIVDIHNFIMEQGGLEELQRRLRFLAALEGGGVDNWVGYECIDWDWVSTGVETDD